jgi:hypothetical protein
LQRRAGLSINTVEHNMRSNVNVNARKKVRGKMAGRMEIFSLRKAEYRNGSALSTNNVAIYGGCSKQ